MSGLVAVGLNVVNKYEQLGMMYPGGNEFNVAVYAVWLGARGAFLGVFGSDEAGRYVAGVLDRLGVDFSHSRFREGENGYAMVRLEEGERVFGEYNHGGVTGLYPIKLDEEDLSYIRGFDAASSSINAHLGPDQIRKIRGVGVPVSFDFSDLYSAKDLAVFAPLADYSFFSCSALDKGETEKLLRTAHSLSGSLCVATRGAKGATAFDGRDFYEQEAVPVAVVDTMGAGDAFIAGFLLRHIHEKNTGLGTAVSIRRALSAAAENASKICKLEGAIGIGTRLV
jgi:fructoselysine 6-kinase